MQSEYFVVPCRALLPFMLRRTCVLPWSTKWKVGIVVSLVFRYHWMHTSNVTIDVIDHNHFTSRINPTVSLKPESLRLELNFKRVEYYYSRAPVQSLETSIHPAFLASSKVRGWLKNPWKGKGAQVVWKLYQFCSACIAEIAIKRTRTDNFDIFAETKYNLTFTWIIRIIWQTR